MNHIQSDIFQIGGGGNECALMDYCRSPSFMFGGWDLQEDFVHSVHLLHST